MSFCESCEKEFRDRDLFELEDTVLCSDCLLKREEEPHSGVDRFYASLSAKKRMEQWDDLIEWLERIGRGIQEVKTKYQGGGHVENHQTERTY